jgi:cell wall-associated NlpC family hydrolase
MPEVNYPTEKQLKQYIGIDFIHGSQDCYGLIRKVYMELFGITLTDYARPDNWWEHEETISMYTDNFEKEGFRYVESDLIRDWEVGDIILMAIKSTLPCHGAIYLGNGKILHHFYGRKSCIENYCRIWKNTTTGVIRHKDLKFIKVVERMSLADDDRIKSFMLLQQERSRARGNNN